MAALASSLLRLALPLLGAVALLAASPVSTHRTESATATISGNVKKPRPAKRTTQIARARKLSASRAPKRPIKAKPPVKRAAVPSSTTSAPITPNDPLWSNSWSLAKANAPAAWKLTSGAPETVVAVLDTGVDLAQPDLAGSFVQGYDVVNRDDDPSDDHGHGTMVAGVVAARANNGLGGVGVCSRCALMPVKVIAGNGSGQAADIAEGIRWAADHGADVVNMSFMLSAPDDGVEAAVAHAQQLGVIVVAAAGNAGAADATFPAAYGGVVSVAGSDPADARYDWSSYGGWVRVAAPGCTMSTVAGGGYGEFCGTSSATAFVSGIVGLARSLVADRPSGEIVEKLTATASPVGGFVASGRVDAGGLLESLRGPGPETIEIRSPSAAPVSNRSE